MDADGTGVPTTPVQGQLGIYNSCNHGCPAEDIALLSIDPCVTDSGNTSSTVWGMDINPHVF